MVLMSESIDCLQNMLNSMSRYLSRFLISCLGSFGFICSQNFKLFVFQIFRYRAYLMNDIPETRRAH